LQHCLRVLTVNADFDPLADSGWNSVGGDAQVGAHVEATDARQIQHFTFVFDHWNRYIEHACVTELNAKSERRESERT
jgi:hypothetical protein